MTFSEKLVGLRRKAGLSQEELASRLEVSRQAVSKWENGTSDPSTSNLIALAKLFDLSAEELLARALVHEIEHLDGGLYVNKVEGRLYTIEEFEKEFGE